MKSKLELELLVAVLPREEMWLYFHDSPVMAFGSCISCTMPDLVELRFDIFVWNIRLLYHNNFHFRRVCKNAITSERRCWWLRSNKTGGFGFDSR